MVCIIIAMTTSENYDDIYKWDCTYVQNEIKIPFNNIEHCIVCNYCLPVAAAYCCARINSG